MDKNKIDIIKNLDRYTEFIFLEKVTPFAEIFADRDILVVQKHSSQLYYIDQEETEMDVVGFTGQFKWENNEIISLDGDIYSENMSVLAYDYFDYLDEDGAVQTGLDVLIDY